MHRMNSASITSVVLRDGKSKTAYIAYKGIEYTHTGIMYYLWALWYNSASISSFTSLNGCRSVTIMTIVATSTVLVRHRFEWMTSYLQFRKPVDLDLGRRKCENSSSMVLSETWIYSCVAAPIAKFCRSRLFVVHRVRILVLNSPLPPIQPPKLKSLTKSYVTSSIPNIMINRLFLNLRTFDLSDRAATKSSTRTFSAPAFAQNRILGNLGAPLEQDQWDENLFGEDVDDSQDPPAVRNIDTEGHINEDATNATQTMIPVVGLSQISMCPSINPPSHVPCLDIRTRRTWRDTDDSDNPQGLNNTNGLRIRLISHTLRWTSKRNHCVPVGRISWVRPVK